MEYHYVFQMINQVGRTPIDSTSIGIQKKHSLDGIFFIYANSLGRATIKSASDELTLGT